MGQLQETEKPENNNVESTDSDKSTNLFDMAKEGIVKAVDQNADGTLDLQDIAIIANNIGDSAKKAAEAVKGAVTQNTDQIGKFISKTKRDIDLKTLRPLFISDINTTSFSMPDLIRITNMDKRHSASEVCKGSIAHMSNHNGLELINIYKNHLDNFALEFSPDSSHEIYYKDPCVSNRYIALDEYFHYLKEARINELKGIAQDLGAKYFKITYQEANKSAKLQKAMVGAKQKAGSVNFDETVSHSTSSNTSVSIEIAAERYCIGHDPVTPKVVYYKNDSTVQELISSRINKQNITTRDRLTLKCSKSSCMKINDAKKIDMLLRTIKCSLNISIVKEAQNEEQRILEYVIEF